MNTRPVFICASLLAATITLGAPPVAAQETVEQRVDALERELATLKLTPGKEPWRVNDWITFRPGLRIQTRYSVGDDSDDLIQIKRFRIKGSGTLHDFAKYGAELKIDGTGTAAIPGTPTPTAAVENAWIEFTKLEHVNARFGLYDIPFSRSNLTSDSKLLFMDRSIIRGRLSKVGLSDNTIGALLHGRPDSGRLEYAAGVFQNDNFRRVPTVSARVVLNLLDPPKQGGYADYRASHIGEGTRLAISLNAAYTPNVEDDSLGLDYDLSAFGSDLFFNTGPFSFQAEYNWFERNSESIGGNPVTSGGYLQAGLMLGPVFGHDPSSPSALNATELGVRHQFVDDETAPGGALEGDARWTSLGVNYYVRKHNLKVQMEFTNKEANFTSSTQDDWMFQLQLQFDF